MSLISTHDVGVTPVGESVDRWARLRPNDIAMSYGPKDWTWAQLQERIRRNAAAQQASGIRPGERIAFLDKNNPACIETTLASALTGAATAVINFRLSPAEIAYIINDAQAAIVMVGAELAGVIDGIRDQLPSVRQVIVVGSAGELEDQYEAWIAGADDSDFIAVDFDPDECFLQLYTSGTTGHPKGAMLTHRSIGAHTVAAVPGFGFDDTTINMVAMPLFHVGGSAWALAAMSAGARTVIVRDVVPGPLLDELVDRRVTHAFFVPAVFGFLVQTPGVADRDYSSLRCLGYGGSPMPLPLLRSCLQVWPDVGFYQVYGMTEMSGVFAILDPADHRDADHPERLVSAGKPVRGVTVKVVDAAGNTLGPDEIGEFWTQSAQHMSGYWNNPGATSEAMVGDDWLRTGDAGTMDAGGYLYIRDRVKDMILSGGENVYPAEVERVLIEHPAVADVAVVGVPDPVWGEQVKAVVVAAPDAEIVDDELIAFCRDRLAGYKCPKSVDVVTELPRNTTGKILKREIRKQFWQDRGLHD